MKTAKADSVKWCASTTPTRKGRSRGCVPETPRWDRLSASLNAHSICSLLPNKTHLPPRSVWEARGVAVHAKMRVKNEPQRCSSAPLRKPLQTIRDCVERLFRQVKSRRPLRAYAPQGAARTRSGREVERRSAQDREPGQVRSARTVSWQALRAYQRRAASTRAVQICALWLASGVVVRRVGDGRRPARRGPHVTAQPQPASAPGWAPRDAARLAHRARSRHRAGAGSRSRGRRRRRCDRPATARTRSPSGLARAAQLRITQSDGNARQLAGLTQRGVPTLLLEELFDVGQVPR